MDLPPLPESWSDNGDYFETLDEQFNSNNDYIIRCGVPGSEEPKTCCYIFFNLATDTTAQIVSPTKDDDLWKALEYWDPDTEEDAEKCAKYERLLVVDDVEANSGILHSAAASNTVMVIPPAPRGWSGHPDKLVPHDTSFNTNGLYILPKPYKTLLRHESEYVYVIQRGIPASNDPNQFCYIMYSEINCGAGRIVSPSRIEEIWAALPYYFTDEHEKKGVRTENIAMDADVASGSSNQADSHHQPIHE